MPELLQLLEVEPWLDPHLGLVYLLLPGVDDLDGQVVKSPHNHLLPRLDHTRELQQGILRHKRHKI